MSFYFDVESKLYCNCLMVTGSISMFFSTIYTKGNNFCYFLFASMDDEGLSKWVSSKGKVCSYGSKLFS